MSFCSLSLSLSSVVAPIVALGNSVRLKLGPKPPQASGALCSKPLTPQPKTRKQTPENPQQPNAPPPTPSQHLNSLETQQKLEGHHGYYRSLNFLVPAFPDGPHQLFSIGPLQDVPLKHYSPWAFTNQGIRNPETLKPENPKPQKLNPEISTPLAFPRTPSSREIRPWSSCSKGRTTVR